MRDRRAMETRWVGADGDLRRRSIERRARALGKLLDAEAVILFGSLARGDHGVYADVDLMAVTADSAGARGIRKYNHETDVVVTTATALKESALRPWSVEAEAIRHGWVLYDQEARTVPWRTTAARMGEARAEFDDEDDDATNAVRHGRIDQAAPKRREKPGTVEVDDRRRP